MHKKVKTLIFILVAVPLFILSLLHIRSWVMSGRVDNYRIVVLDAAEHRFVDKSSVIKFVEKTNGEVLGRNRDSISLHKIEKKLKNSNYIEDCEVYYSMAYNKLYASAVLNIIVDQKDPILRVVSKKRDFYLDAHKSVIPWSPKYTEKTPIITGNTDLDFIKNELFDLCLFIQNDRFLRSLIDQIDIDKNGELVMIPKVGDFRVIFGTPEKYKRKFKYLKAFYRQVLANEGWGKYRRINLKYEGQVVCS
ncbi:hypothetical protein K5X82_13510 [Halosquirtibacter xylanolyticus]|uniref:cell division protein FtsQ/DivIB n=1 Tax=Halosquirtibacter xylanolyticus TaxID=3374599 RepID=UPI0037486C05|nr:hypothetical protein K5X82_13510 [Prolixibacteraceae bacterium]